MENLIHERQGKEARHEKVVSGVNRSGRELYSEYKNRKDKKQRRCHQQIRKGQSYTSIDFCKLYGS